MKRLVMVGLFLSLLAVCGHLAVPMLSVSTAHAYGNGGDDGDSEPGEMGDGDSGDSGGDAGDSGECSE